MMINSFERKIVAVRLEIMNILIVFMPTDKLVLVLRSCVKLKIGYHRLGVFS